MMIPMEDGKYATGQADILCILKLPAGTYHCAFFEESPMPGQIEPIEKLKIIRLKSKAHHTEGSATLEGAQAHVADLRTKLILPDGNVFTEQALMVADPVNVWLVPNWLAGKETLRDVLLTFVGGEK